MINYYHVLGLSQKASQEEIKLAYRKLALRFHPDRNPGSDFAEARFKEISHAYQVLKDPQKKALHDHALAYASLHIQTTRPYAAPNTFSEGPLRKNNPRYRSRRHQTGGAYKPTASKPVNSRQNLIATVWAFGIFFVIAVLGISLTSYRSYQIEQMEAQEQEQARAAFREAEKYFQEGKYQYSLDLLKALRQQHQVPYDAGQLKERIFQTLEEKADLHFKKAEYKKSAEYYQLLVNHQSEYHAFTYARLVSSYEMIPDYPQAIEVYQQVIRAEPLTIAARNRLASIFFKLQDYEQALFFYQQASEIVAREYQERYGEAYAIALNPRKIPDSHYQLHCGLGKTYTALSMHKEAEASFRWAIFLQPENPEAYLLQGKNFQQASQPRQACKSWERAQDKGSLEAAEPLKSYCR